MKLGDLFKRKIKISVIIPALNEENFIGDTVKAVRKQKFSKKEYEIIVVDNGSTDKTALRAKAAGADKIVYEENRGINFAKSKGISVSKGEIIAFLDADCRPKPGWLQSIEKSFKENHNLGCLSGPYGYELEKIGVFYDFTQKVIFPLAIKALNLLTGKKGALALGGNMALKRSAIEEIGGLDVHYTFWGEDTDTVLRIVRKGYEAVFDSEFAVFSSPRRLKEGHINIALKYISVYLERYFKD
ncbi:MAG: glycosyltransferase family 2 protein [Patescibacteria group bacterium]|nr:glycosyltransferase family 2 protein [Patescibacteria group bacterium]